MTGRFLRKPGRPQPVSTYQPDPPASVIAQRPPLDGPVDPSGDSDACREWLAHLAAGRIEVR